MSSQTFVTQKRDKDAVLVTLDSRKGKDSLSIRRSQLCYFKIFLTLNIQLISLKMSYNDMGKEKNDIPSFLLKFLGEKNGHTSTHKIHTKPLYMAQCSVLQGKKKKTI